MQQASSHGLADRLRRETAALHHEAERSPLMAALIGGTIERAAYVALLRNLHALYLALEAALDTQRSDARFDFLRVAPLLRAARIAEDLDALGADVPSAALAAATVDYTRHLATLAGHDPLRLVAHAYVRYLGDLYGGQQLARGLRQRFALSGERGTRFYDFGAVAEVAALRAAFRGGLDALPLAAGQADAIVAEARAAFERHIALFRELGRELGRDLSG